MVRLNQTTQKHIGKVIYSLLIMSIMESLFTISFILPAVSIFFRESISLQSKALSFFLLFIAVLIWLTFQFGFSVMLLRMVRDERTTLGYIFLGFKKIRYCFKYILGISFVLVVAVIITRFVTNAIWDKFVKSNFEELSAAIIQIAQFALTFFVIAYLLMVRFAFVFQLHFDNPAKPVMTIFSKSASMMKGNVLKLTFFALRAGGKNLLIVIALVIAINLIPGDARKSMTFLSYFLNFIYFINFYTASAKIYFTIPILYTAIEKQNAGIRHDAGTEHDSGTDNDADEIQTPKEITDANS